MTKISVHVVGGVPLIRLAGPITATSGAELANEVMSAIYYMTEDPAEFLHPLSLPRSRLAS
ncbi:Uncharacterised protein (plasmid) [Tsukamurella tyrosinosolvens]|uniref:Uncharacterized protein n=1 Tax=Tsukamurella tyrosinosolvens TaxID=57704 RepID=A0A1H4VIL5_TSUTY|nr:hypothetical protein [Tsukamurella tyrosinosolvens]KXO90980.1 hypothetical protein AXK58_21350 [Tsukamurella tyrosinosolvens]SEC80194.1 hypothetical protein SAMN04489793_3224 [Tsukamurella tyrosinosolvens]VEH90526.1 Uncharacterised protein [Tsukamurella tyrosinosolvens]